MGAGTIRSRYGDVAYESPALVDVDTWERAQQATIRNRKLSRKNAKREYHLRGLLTCGLCGLGYVGATNKLGRLYRCCGQTGKSTARGEPCPAGILNADRIEDAIWQEARAFIDNPGPYIEQAQRELLERLATAGKSEDQRKRLAAELAGNEQERERVLGMFRRGRITSDEAERELDAIATEAAHIRDLMDSLRVRVEMAAAQEAYLVDVGAAQARMQGRVQQIEEENDWTAKRELIELLVPRVVVHTQITGTTPGGRRRKEARVALTLAFRSESAVVHGRRIAGRSITPWTASLTVNDIKFWRGGLITGEDFFQAMKEAFDTLYEEGSELPRMMNVGLHCRIAGRPGRANGLDRFIAYAKSHPNVWFAGRADIARTWLEQFPPEP